MKNSKVLTAVLVIIMIFLALDVGSRIISHEPELKAGSKLKYKVVSFETPQTPEKYEQVLNEMANKGWTYDHFAMTATAPGGAIVFRK